MSSYVRFKTSYFKVSLMQDSLLLATKDSLTEIAPVSLDSHWGVPPSLTDGASSAMRRL